MGLCASFFYLWQITVMSDKKFACRTNFKLYQTFCLVKIFLNVIAWVSALKSYCDKQKQKKKKKPKVFILVCPCRARLFSKSSLAWLQEFWNSSICLHEIKKKNLSKSACLTGSFTYPGPTGSGRQRALPCKVQNEWNKTSSGMPIILKVHLKPLCAFLMK